MVSNGHLGMASGVETIPYESDEDGVTSISIIRVLRQWANIGLPGKPVMVTFDQQ